MTPAQAQHIGKTWDAGVQRVLPEHVLAYARATCDPNPAYEGPGAIAPPLFHARLMKPLLFGVIWDEALALDALRLLHGEHQATLARPLRVGEAVHAHARLLEVEARRAGLLVGVGMYGDVDGERVIDCLTRFFIPSGPAPSAERAPPPPPAEADFVVELRVPDDASLRYAEASLDDNPIHVDPETARRAGYPGCILQGLCTLAMTMRAAVDEIGGGQPAFVREVAARFTRPVLNGQGLVVRGVEESHGRWAIETRDPEGHPVLARGRLVLG